MYWNKLGLVYAPNIEKEWAVSHAMIPTPVLHKPGVIRVYVTFCDSNQIGRPGYVDVNAMNPLEVLDVSTKPLLDIGRPGTFDENGVLVCSVLPMNDNTLFMYYVGFELGTKIRYRLLTGLAISRDNGETFERFSQTPVLERSDQELHVRGGPWAVKEGNKIRLWYVGGSEWIELQGKSMPVYDIRYVESVDGIHFPPSGSVQVPVTEHDEYGFGRPCVIKRSDERYSLFYSVRRRSLAAYRLGYAESTNGKDWERMDNRLNLDVSLEGFDSQAIMYAAPIQVNNKLYVFYNGNDFGRAGFAVAVLEEE